MLIYAAIANALSFKVSQPFLTLYKGSITVPEKGCYFLFADLPLAYLRPVPVTASFGKVQNADHARFSTVKPGLGLLYTGSKSGWFFFLDKGTWPFTLKISGTPFKAENIFITSKPEEILR